MHTQTANVKKTVCICTVWSGLLPFSHRKNESRGICKHKVKAHNGLQMFPVHQIRRGNRDNLGIIFHISS